MNIKFKLTGLDCANCANQLERTIQKIDGINNANISFMTQKMELELDETRKEEIIKNVKKVIKKEEPDVEIEQI